MKNACIHYIWYYVHEWRMCNTLRSWTQRLGHIVVSTNDRFVGIFNHATIFLALNPPHILKESSLLDTVLYCRKTSTGWPTSIAERLKCLSIFAQDCGREARWLGGSYPPVTSYLYCSQLHTPSTGTDWYTSSNIVVYPILVKTVTFQRM